MFHILIMYLLLILSNAFLSLVTLAVLAYYLQVLLVALWILFIFYIVKYKPKHIVLEEKRIAKIRLNLCLVRLKIKKY